MSVNPILQEIRRQGRRRPRRLQAAALETARVESNFTNPQGGDADSAGWRQERRSLYRDPTNVSASVRRFYREAEQLDRGQPSYQLAADVQRPAAQFRGRYRDAHAEAMRLLQGGTVGGGTGQGQPGQVSPASVALRRQRVFDSRGFAQAQRTQLVAQMLQRSGRGNSVLFRSGLLSTAAPDRADFTSTRLRSSLIPGTTIDTSSGGGGGGGGVPAGQMGKAIVAARKRLGVSETTGANRGPRVDRMEQRFGMVGQAWCGIFAGTVLRKAGVRGIGSWIASVPEIERQARARSGPFDGFTSPRNARAGDLLITVKGQHVGVVERVDRDGTIHTIEGNTGNGTVARRAHPAGSVYGVARVRYRRR